MRKLLYLGALLLITSLAQADTATTAKSIANQAINTVDSGITAVDTSSTFRMFYTDLKAGTLALASSLKVGATEVFKICVKQQIVESISMLLLGLFGFALLNRFVKGATDKEEEWDSGGSPTALGAVRFIQASIGAILVLMFLICFTDIITGLINPEYGAIMSIMDMIRHYH